MLSSIGRAAIRRVAAGNRSTTGAVLSFKRVESCQIQRTVPNQRQSQLSTSRTYATATASQTVPKTSANTKTSTKAKAPAKKTVDKPVKKPTKKSVKKPAKKLAAKPKRKAVSKAKPKRRGLTEKQKETLALQKSKQKEKAAARKTKEKAKAALEKSKLNAQELKATALEIPKRRPDSGWKLFISQHMESGLGKGAGLKKLAEEYNALSTEEKDRLSNTAAENAALNKVTFTQWVESHTPLQILEANQARTKLRRNSTKSYPKIYDARKPTKAISPWIRFFLEKKQAPEFDDMLPKDIMKALSSHWKSLSEAERKPYVDSYEAHQLRFEQEYKTVFHRDLPSASSHAKTS